MEDEILKQRADTFADFIPALLDRVEGDVRAMDGERNIERLATLKRRLSLVRSAAELFPSKNPPIEDADPEEAPSFFQPLRGWQHPSLQGRVHISRPPDDSWNDLYGVALGTVELIREDGGISVYTQASEGRRCIGRAGAADAEAIRIGLAGGWMSPWATVVEILEDRMTLWPT